MRNKIRKKSILIMVSLFLVLSFVSIVRAADVNSDMAITSKVNEKFQSDSQLMGSQIFVETKNGEVTLKGMVNSQADITRAGKLTHNVNGVKNVDNRLKTVKASLSSSHYHGRSLPPSYCLVGEKGEC